MSGPTIKAIETVYNGYRFRSRLEARWAVFFDVLGIEYQYEPEGFDLGDGDKYLPDFWINTWKCWVEIKPEIPHLIQKENGHLVAVDKSEYRTCANLARHTRKPVWLIGGQPWANKKAPLEEGLFEYGIAIFLPDAIVRHKLEGSAGIEVNFPRFDRFIIRTADIFEETYCLSDHLYGFIYQLYKKFPQYFDKPMPARGDAHALIEADRAFYLRHYGREHYKWRYGISCDGLVFSENSLHDELILTYPSLCLCISDFLSSAFAAARQARFEHGEAPRSKAIPGVIISPYCMTTRS